MLVRLNHLHYTWDVICVPIAQTNTHTRTHTTCSRLQENKSKEGGEIGKNKEERSKLLHTGDEVITWQVPLATLRKEKWKIQRKLTKYVLVIRDHTKCFTYNV